jgi:D-glycero-beta-D-manno-heptose 1-phosphate adenylyltransferase
MKTVFTNGCFDLIHRGHVDLLRRARELGDWLIVGLNSDASVRGMKGPSRPVQTQEERAAILRAIRYVDEVIIFDDATPSRLIERVRPDVLVKGGDWPLAQIVGADFVIRRGGKVFSLPLVPGYSTTSLVERLWAGAVPPAARTEDTLEDCRLSGLRESIRVKTELLAECGKAILTAGQILVETLSAGNRILIFGNGASGAEARQIAAEIADSSSDRIRLPAIAFAVDGFALAVIGKDDGSERQFERQLETLARAGDAVIAISTSGNSPNVLAAVMRARQLGCQIVGLTGQGGKQLAGLCDITVLVPSTKAARVQECHTTIGHLWSEMVGRSVLRPQSDAIPTH